MSFCRILDGQVVNVRDVLPVRAPLERTGQIIENLPELGDVMWNACGWYTLLRTIKPPDTATTTWDETNQVIDGRPQIVWVERAKAPEALRPVSVEESAAALAALGVLPELTELSDADVSRISAVFPPLITGIRAQVGHIYRWDGTLVEIVQAHTVSLEEWVPGPDTLALYRVHRATGVVTVWVQPAGAHDAYRLGEFVSHDGSEYESLIAANTTVPGGDPRWWKPLTVEPPLDGPQPWVPWSGNNNDLYQVGDEVTHAGETWRSNTADNHWEPGVVADVWVVI